MNLVYRGRGDAVPAVDGTVLTEWDVLPADLLPALASADALLVLDPTSFPFEALRPADWDVPVMISLLGLDEDDITALPEDALRRLLPHDAVVSDRATWRAVSADRAWPEGTWLGADLDAASRRFVASADRASKAATRARAAVLRQQLQQVHPWTAWDADGSVRALRAALPSYIEWVDAGPAAAVVGSGVPDAPSLARWWEAVSEGGSLVLLAEVVGVGRPAATDVRDRVLAAGPLDVRLADVESVVERSSPHRTAAVFTFTRGDG